MINLNYRLNYRMTVLLGLALLWNATVSAQDDAQPKGPQYIVVTTFHWNMDMDDFKMDDWKAGEKEYFDKVTNKNDLILGTDVANHYFTADNSELVFVSTYASWADIDAAGKKSTELAKAAWPDDDKRKAFFKARNAYYTDFHSDEIYAVAPNTKPMMEPSKEPMIIYLRKSKMAFPEDGSREEYDKMMKEFTEATIAKNEFIKGYYPHFHAWGSDRRDFLEAFVVSSLGDIEKSFDKNEELAKAKWPDEKARKEFQKKLGTYFTGSHGDFIYKNIPELVK